MKQKIRFIQNYCVEKNLTLALCESMTGGSLANLFTSVSGSSKYFFGSLVLYHIFAKKHILNESINNPNNFKQLKLIAKKSKSMFLSDIMVAVSGYTNKNGNNKCYAKIVIMIGENIYTYKINLVLNIRWFNKRVVCNKIINYLYKMLKKQSVMSNIL